MPALPRPLVAALLAALALAGCDSADDGSPFDRLRGTWERTDAGFTGESVRFGPGQDYAFRVDGAVVERGLFAVLDGEPGASAFTVRYAPEATTPPGGVGQPGDRPRPDEAARIDGDALVLTPPGGAVRTYRRD